MKQFKTIFCHEYMSYLKNKPFIVTTILVSVMLIIGMCIPAIVVLFKSFTADDDTTTNNSKNTEEKSIILLKADDTFSERLALNLQSVFNESEIIITTDTIDNIQTKIKSEEVEQALVFDSALSYTYYVNTKELYDNTTSTVDSILKKIFLVDNFVQAGFSIEEAQKAVSQAVQSNVVSLSVDQSENFGMAYVMIFALYIMVILYGSLIATNVATEKSSRAMELLITSARPSYLLFGKVFATCTAALSQIGVIILCGIITFFFTNQFWTEIPMIGAIFNISAEIVIYFVLYFIMGFLLYAFMFAAIASTASKLEDTNTSLFPVIIIFIVSFILTINNLFTGADSTLFKVLSYIPFSASMAMFARIALTDIPFWEPLLSIGILFVSIIGIGYISAKIYKIGVLLYGTQPKIKDIFKALKTKV